MAFRAKLVSISVYLIRLDGMTIFGLNVFPSGRVVRSSQTFEPEEVFSSHAETLHDWVVGGLELPQNESATTADVEKLGKQETVLV